MGSRHFGGTNGDSRGAADRPWEGPFAVDDPQTLQEIAELRARVWRNEPELFDGQCLEAWMLHDAHDDHGRHWIIKSQGRIVAAARFCVHHADTRLPHQEAYDHLIRDLPRPAASFNRMVVDPTMRRQGLTGALTEVRIAAAREAGARSIIVEATPNRMPPLLALGFVSLGRSDSYRGDRVDYTLMKLDLV